MELDDTVILIAANPVEARRQGSGRRRIGREALSQPGTLGSVRKGAILIWP